MATTDKFAAMVAKVEALLNKAASTDFEAEAESLTAKAEELMSKYQIDAAALSVGKTIESKPTKVTVPQSDVWARQMRYLMHVCCEHFGVTDLTPYRKKNRIMDLYGFEDDVQMAVMLYESLRLQAIRSLDRAKVTDCPPEVPTRTFSASFLMAFSTTIRQRLGEIRRLAQVDAAPGVGLVLYDRAKMVDEITPKFTKGDSFRIRDASGGQSGRAAGQRADIGQKRFKATRQLNA